MQIEVERKVQSCEDDKKIRRPLPLPPVTLFPVIMELYF